MRFIIAIGIIFFLQAVEYNFDRIDAYVLVIAAVYGLVLDIIEAKKGR